MSLAALEDYYAALADIDRALSLDSDFINEKEELREAILAAR
jgi:hypothetical protein